MTVVWLALLTPVLATVVWPVDAPVEPPVDGALLDGALLDGPVATLLGPVASLPPVLVWGEEDAPLVAVVLSVAEPSGMPVEG